MNLKEFEYVDILANWGTERVTCLLWFLWGTVIGFQSRDNLFIICCKGHRRKQCWYNGGHNPGIFLKVLRKTTRTVIHNYCCLYQNSDRQSPEYGSGPLPFEPASSIHLSVRQGMSCHKGLYTRRHHGCATTMRSEDTVVKLSTQ